MLNNLPTFISVFFGLTTLATLVLLALTVRKVNSEKFRIKSIFVFFAFAIWLTIQALITLNNVYNTDTNSFPPKIMLMGILPPILIIVLLFVTAKGRQFMDSLPLKNLTYIHTIRIPVEIVLYWLFLHKAVPELMTFEGRNFDIIAGITAPFIAYFGLTKFKLNRNVLLFWNFICLGLLMNIVVNALLSAPTPIQKFAFEQPNIGILYFPFCWLPTFVVPVVLFAHLVSIRQLLKKNNFQN